MTTGWTECDCKVEGDKYVHGVVLDIFMGSGTVGVAASNLSRDYVGIEMNPNYVEIAKKRLSEFEDCLDY
jgi:DNA modification methylase